ncbi:hypothetical protein F5Y02DRAFT_23281 [Annulohypoxylon stygium]|nr:hypothetical protein F5Y02DRAFT_23281 [Annulohypoxylon stygium]
MAIIPQVPGVEVTILINKRAAVEYDDPNASEMGPEKNSVVKKYIRCEEDALFEIHCKVTKEYDWSSHKSHYLGFDAFIDGYRVGGLIFPHNLTEKSDDIISYYQSQDNSGQRVGSRFKFASIDKVDYEDENQHIHDMHRVAIMGTICVQVRQVQFTGAAPLTPLNGAPLNNLTIGSKALKGKAISHGTQYSAPEKVNPVPMSEYSAVPGDESPNKLYIFLYRSEEALIQEGVLPRPQSLPSPQSGEETEHISLEGLTREQIETLARERLREFRKTATILKRKREEENSEQERKVMKREDAQTAHQAGLSTQPKTSTAADGKVIKLEDD